MKFFLPQLAAGCLALFTCLAANAGKFPEQNFEALAGVNEVEAVVYVHAFEDGPMPDEEVMERHFRMGIIKEGVAIRAFATYPLLCRIHVMTGPEFEGWFYTISLEFYDRMPQADLYTLLYQSSQFARTSDPRPWKEIGEKCAGLFRSAWLRANPVFNDLD